MNYKITRFVDVVEFVFSQDEVEVVDSVSEFEVFSREIHSSTSDDSRTSSMVPYHTGTEFES